MTATVLQCDREAAEEAYLTCYEYPPNEAWLAALKAGKHDDDELLQLFARHRHDSTREMKFTATVGLRRQKATIDSVAELLRLINGGAALSNIATLQGTDR